MTTQTSSPAAMAGQQTALTIIFAVSGAHLLNDLLQFLLPALFPLLKVNYGLSYLQIG
ncbi:MAG: MFS transporter, partial [Hyphomicrobiales bacterium]